MKYIKNFKGNFLTYEKLIEIKHFKGENFSTFSTDEELIKNLKKVLDDLNEEQIEILSKLRNCINEPNLSGGYKFKKYKKRKLSKKIKNIKKEIYLKKEINPKKEIYLKKENYPKKRNKKKN